jgi:hypothetical protein
MEPAIYLLSTGTLLRKYVPPETLVLRLGYEQAIGAGQ